jgi:glycosyltransferase involved in cell wall biosynthesis
MKLIISVLGDATGGRWKVVLDYVEVLCEAGCQILLILNSKKISTDLPLPKDVCVKLIRNSGHYDPFATFSANRLIKKFQPDAIICHCGRSTTLMKRAALGKVPVIAVNHSNNVKRTVCADVYFNISQHIGSLIQGFSASKGKKHYHIPNMVAMPVTPQWIKPISHQPVQIGAFGRFDVVKGFHVFIEALAILKMRGVLFHARLGGDGIQRDELLHLISQHSLENEIQLIGWVKNQQEFFQNTDIFCVPALSDAFGITPLEAAVASIPIVASDAQGHQEMFLHNHHALLVSRGNADEMADALFELMVDSGKAEKISQNAFNRVTSEYNREKFTKVLIQALRDSMST